MRNLSFFFIFSISFFVFVKVLSYLNYKQVYPSLHEIEVLKNYIGDITINNESDLIRIQNKTFDIIEYKGPGNQTPHPIIIDSLFVRKRALCYERSLLLQKIMLFNNIDVTPVFLYWNEKLPLTTNFFDLFKRKTNSHNIFEISYKGKQFVIQTNYRQNKLVSLEEYLSYSKVLPKGVKYIKHLNNRNGDFIPPSWIPDFY